MLSITASANAPAFIQRIKPMSEEEIQVLEEQADAFYLSLACN